MRTLLIRNIRALISCDENDTLYRNVDLYSEDGIIRAIGMILLGWGIVQVGLSFQSHDPSQRSNGFLTLAGGIVITFAKEILDLIIGTSSSGGGGIVGGGGGGVVPL